MKILIAGSRRTTEPMLRYAHYCVARAARKQYTVIVGDNPHGIDDYVVKNCIHFPCDFEAYGIQENPRNAAPPYFYHYLSALSGTPRERYYARDRWMCEQADRGVFIWNGSSPGTKAGYDYMATLPGKTAVLVNSAGEIIQRADVHLK